MNYPADLRYSKDHEWVKRDGDSLLVGISDYAQHELGDIVYVDIQATGSHFAEGEVFGTVEAVKTVSDMFLPVAGTIEEINPLLEKQPELVNTDPYGQGWMVKVRPDNAADIENLLSAEKYQELVG